MHRISLLFVSIILCLPCACNESTQSPARTVLVLFEIGSSFQNDLVTLLLDDKPLLESRITTNDVLSLAWSSGFKELSNDSHSLYFAVADYGVHESYKIDLTTDTSTVVISLNKSAKQISFQQFKGRMLRD
ncbi:MAG TPA: hypothetical protein DEP53_19215 [Bacteroidetes bacterium]|nr:MAG: hypothetical protein A2X66_09860 [Ignavibacteria bacterium GWA2_54_16]HCA81867.1 hypothetical protein [Bacteroidota bacterium]